MLIEEPIFHKDFETTFLTIVKLPNELKALVLPAKKTNTNLLSWNVLHQSYGY